MANTSSFDVMGGETLVSVLYVPGPAQVTYAITGGADAALFQLGYQGVSPSAARLEFKTAPDARAPADEGRDNQYQVEVTANLGTSTQVTSYNLRVLPDDFAGNTSTVGRLLTDGTPVSGELSLGTDKDWFRFESDGSPHLFMLGGVSYWGIANADGTVRSYSSGGGGELVLQPLALPAGTYFVMVGGPENWGGATGPYAVSVAKSGPTLFPTEGDDQRTGSALSDFLYGNGGNDTLVGLDGRDFLFGYGGNDSLDGGPQTDFLRGGDGNDLLAGGGDFDDLHGNQGNDTLQGQDGDDWVVGGKDNDQLSGDAGSDIVYGNLGNDTCYGGDGNDLIRGGQNDDVLYGGAGDDWLSGDKHNDTISGGAGADTFHTFGDAGIDRVLDFNRAEGDRVQLDPGTVYTFAQSGGDVVISMHGGAQMVLVGVNIATLTDGWVFGQ